MTEPPLFFLVTMPDAIGSVPSAMRYACFKARETGSCVALLATVQQDDIGAWGGVDQLMTDDAFDRARKVMTHYAAFVEKASGAKAKPLFRKGRRRDVLLEVIEKERGLQAVVLTGATRQDASNALIQYLTSDKGIGKMTVPLIVVPDTLYEEREADDVHSN